MAGTERKAEETDICPYCREGRLSKSLHSNVVSCPVCGAYYEKGILYRSRSVQERNHTQSFKLKRWHNKSRLANAAERNLAFAMSELERLSEENGLNRIAREYAAETYRRAVMKNLVRGRSTDSIVATSVYSACRAFGIPRTLGEVSESSGVSKKELGRTYRFISKGLNLGLSPAKPQDYVSRYCVDLRLSNDVRTKAEDLLTCASEKDALSGLGPKGIAAGAVYIAAHLLGEHRSQSEVAVTADISEVTLRCRYKALAEDLGIAMEFRP